MTWKRVHYVRAHFKTLWQCSGHRPRTACGSIILAKRRSILRLVLPYKIVHGDVAVLANKFLISSDEHTRVQTIGANREDSFRYPFFPCTDWDLLSDNQVSCETVEASQHHKHSAANYRPVSLTCVCTKLLEHIVVKHLMTHYERHNILSNLNHGFRSGFSCESQLLNVTADIMSAYDTNKQVDIAFLDFSKAFDVVPHSYLMKKLEHYGIRGELYAWIGEFLQRRHQSQGATLMVALLPRAS